MSRTGISEAGRAELASLLSAHFQKPATIYEFKTLVKSRILWKAQELGWEPEFCIESSGRLFLVHQLIQDQIPEEVKKTRRIKALPKKRGQKGTRKRKIVPLVFCPQTPATQEIAAVEGTKRGELVIEDCVAAEIPLVCASSEGAVLVLPPGFKPPKPCETESEGGHVPDWLFHNLTLLDAFSPYLRKCFQRTYQVYQRKVQRGNPDYDSEAEILIKLLQDIRKGDPRLFMPLDRLHALKSWERAQANTKSRDHFFHTINNLLLGYLVLGYILGTTERMSPPESFLQDTKNIPRLLTWESLWFLTCINHDPAYSAEHFWANYNYSIGVPGAATIEPIPQEAVNRLIEAWQTNYDGARNDLSELYTRLNGEWFPPQLVPKVPEFDRALREVYWNGQKSSHSLMSGLLLITNCEKDKTVKSKAYDKVKAVTACDIAALSMMFHDQHCRRVLGSFGVKPIAFENLPYASILMFVDSLQDDRRDIAKIHFNKHEILTSIVFDKAANEVVAQVCLGELPLKYWPGKIAEYESSTRWINTASATHFRIDYKTPVDFQCLTKAHRPKKKSKGARRQHKAKNKFAAQIRRRR